MLIQDIRDRLLARAAALGIVAPTEEAAIDALLDRELDIAPPDEADCAAYYARHAATRFGAGPRVTADHILFAVTAGVPLEGLRARATEALEAVRADPASFAARAAALSNCPSGLQGGSLGLLGPADVVPEFWQAIATAAPGVLPALVETRYGLHIVRIVGRTTGAALPYAQVRDRIAALLAEHRLRVALRDYAHRLLHADDAAHAH